MASRRLAVLVALATSLVLGQTPNERLAATAKLWAYVKYFHPTVTEDPVAWDAAFENAAPQVLAARTTDEFTAAIGGMLARLNDPATHLAAPADHSIPASVVPVIEMHDGVAVVGFQPGDPQRATQEQQAMSAQLSGKGPVVFDLRGLRRVPLPDTLPVLKVCQGPGMAKRTHLGYESETRVGTGGYRSTWVIEDGIRLLPGKGGIRPVFLVDGTTGLTPSMLAFQSCGEGAIVSEGPLHLSQVSAPPIPVVPGVKAFVRNLEFVYPDGTTGLTANVVLKQRGAEALRVAEEMARTGNWPQPEGRPRQIHAPARFAEEAYRDDVYPPASRRMLAAARIWAVFHYFHPYQSLYGEDWDKVLSDFLPKMAHAESARAYHLAVAEMITHTHDSHCNIISRELNDFYGGPGPLLELRWIEEQPVVSRVFDSSIGVRPGDVLLRIDGKPYQERADDLAHHIAASTPQSQRGRVMRWLLNGAEGSTVRVTFRAADGREREVELTRSKANNLRKYPSRNGETVRFVAPHIGYVDLERLTNSQVDAMFNKLADTEAIIMDMRGYPQGTAWSIAPRLSDAPGKLAAIFRLDPVSPWGKAGNFIYEFHIPTTDKRRYTGKTVMLIDDRAISQSEHSGLMYKAANGTVFVGSPTTGASGDTTEVVVPGGILIGFSGQEERWPDGHQLQRVGLLPDIEVKPTIEGIRSGRDEVMEKAVEYLQRTLKRP